MFSKIAARENIVGWDGLSPHERVVATVVLLWHEVGHGGFQQYLSNPTGDLAPTAADALREIGAEETANVVDQALGLFPAPGPSPDHEVRRTQLSCFPFARLAQFEGLDSFFFNDPEQVEDRLVEFMSQHEVAE